MDVTNNSGQPIIVEAERGGPGGPHKPPGRYKLEDPENQPVVNESWGGAAFLQPGDQVDFYNIGTPDKGYKNKLKLYVSSSNYAHCFAHEMAAKKGEKYEAVYISQRLKLAKLS